MRALLFLIPAMLGAQVLPIRIGDPINLIPPAINSDGTAVVFAAAVAADGTPLKGTNLYLSTAASLKQLTNYAGDTNLTGVTSVAFNGAIAGYTAMTGIAPGVEEVHLFDVAKSADKLVAKDTESCIQPLCVGCYRSCLRSVHLSADGGKLLYNVSRQQPFYVVNADGTGLTHLPVYSGSLALSPQRVIASDGTFVFTSAAPSGPTFAAAATDIYTVKLDGTGLKQITHFGNAQFFAANATVSADGSVIAFESNYSVDGSTTGPTQIWMVRSDGTDLRQLSLGTDPAYTPSISADGSIVTFVQSGQIRRTVIGMFPLVPLNLTRLSVSAPSYPAISGDGTQVAFTLAPQNGALAAVYRLPLSGGTADLRNFVTIYAPRMVNANGVVSATGYGEPTPGSLFTVFGTNLAVDELTQATGFPLPASLKEVSVFVNGQAVPLLASTPWQINAQMPQPMFPGGASLEVRYSSGSKTATTVFPVVRVFPENFFYPYTRKNLGYSQAAAFHAGTSVPVDMDYPASAGEVIEIYGLGFGVTDPIVPPGEASPSSPPARAVEMPQLQIGGHDAVVVFAGLAPGFAGLYQVDVIVPAGLRPGVQNVTWGVNATVSNSAIGVQ